MGKTCSKDNRVIIIAIIILIIANILVLTVSMIKGSKVNASASEPIEYTEPVEVATTEAAKESGPAVTEPVQDTILDDGPVEEPNFGGPIE